MKSSRSPLYRRTAESTRRDRAREEEVSRCRRSPLTRRAALAALGGLLLGRRGSKRAGATHRPVPRHRGRRLAASRRNGRSHGGLGGAGASRRAGPGLGPLHGAGRSPWRDAGGAHRRSLSRAEQRRSRPAGALRRTRSAARSWSRARGGDRRRDAPIRAISLVPPDGRRPAYARRVQPLAGRGVGAGVRGLGARGSSGSRSSLRRSSAHILAPKTAPNGSPLRRGGDE